MIEELMISTKICANMYHNLCYRHIFITDLFTQSVHAQSYMTVKKKGGVYEKHMLTHVCTSLIVTGLYDSVRNYASSAGANNIIIASLEN